MMESSSWMVVTVIPLWMYLMSLNCACKNAQSKGKSSRNEMKVQKQQQKSPKKDELLW